MLTRAPPVVKLAPHARSRKPPARKTSPNPILAGVEGWRFPRRIQIAPKTGARMIRKIELTDCRKEAGIFHPRMFRLVRRSAKRFSDEPACSNPAQKRTAAMKKTKIRTIRFFSAAERREKRTIAPKYTIARPSMKKPVALAVP